MQLNHIKPYFQLFAETDLPTLKEVIDVDLLSYITITKLLLPQMINHSTSLIVVSSIGGKIGVPYAAIYSAAKHALHGLFESLRLEVSMTHPESRMSITLCVIGNVDTDAAVQVTAGKLQYNRRVSAANTARAIIQVSNI